MKRWVMKVGDQLVKENLRLIKHIFEKQQWPDLTERREGKTRLKVDRENDGRGEEVQVDWEEWASLKKWNSFFFFWIFVI